MTTSAWDAAARRFEVGYGDPPDLADDGDRCMMIQLLTEELRERLVAETDAAELIEAKTARLREVL